MRTVVVNVLQEYLQAEFVITDKLVQKLTGFLKQSKLQRFRMEISRRCRFFAVQIFDQFIAAPADTSSLARDDAGLLTNEHKTDTAELTI